MSTKSTTTELDEQINAVEIKVDPKARRYVKGALVSMMEQLERIVKETARKDRIAITDIEIKYSDLMKAGGMAYIRMVVYTGIEVSPDRALCYWGTIGDYIDRWLPGLEPMLQKLFDKKVTVSVEWIEPDVN